MSAADSPIVAFYRKQRPDSERRTLDDIRSRGHDWLEYTHDYIQWLFPLRTRSQFNARAPVLDDATVRAFLDDPALREELLQSFRVMLGFYGFDLTAPPGGPVGVARAGGWPRRSRNWLTPGNHNFLRITRILTCLRTLGLPEYARAFFAALREVSESGAAGVIGPRTFAFWSEAAGG